MLYSIIQLRAFSTCLQIRNHPQTLQTLLKCGFTPTLYVFNQFLLFLFQSHRFNFLILFCDQLKSNQINGDSFTRSILTKALLKEHKYEEAETLMTQIAKCPNFPRIGLWDSLIQGICVNDNDPDRGLSVLRNCVRIQGMCPSSFTFCSLVHSFSRLGMMGRVVEVLELMKDDKIKYPFDNFVCSSVISGFCKIGRPELALEFYEHAVSSDALKPNLVTYTALVSVLCKLGKRKEASDLVSRMENEGLRLDVLLYSTWVLGHLRVELMHEAFQKHNLMVKKGIKPDVVCYTILIDGLSKAGHVEKGIGFLNKMKKVGLEPNVVTYTAIMLGYCRKGKLEEAFSVLKIVEKLRLKPDEFMYATLIDGACRKGDLDCAFHILEDMEDNGISPSIVTYNSIINGLCKVGRTFEADEIAKQKTADLVTYTTLLHGFTEEENLTGILETKRSLEEAGLQLDVVVCNVLIKALFLVGAFENVYGLYKRMPEMEVVPNSVTYFTLIKGFCKSGRIDEALEIFDDFRKTPISSAESYNCIIHALCRKNMVGMAVEVFVEMCEKGSATDIHSCKVLIKAIFEELGVRGVLDFIERLEEVEHEMCTVVCNDAISFLCKRGFTEAACQIYIMTQRKELPVTSEVYFSILEALLDDGDSSVMQPLLSIFVKEYGLVEPLVRKILVHYLCMSDSPNVLWFLDKMEENRSSVQISGTDLRQFIKNGRILDAYRLVKRGAESEPMIDLLDYSMLVDSLCKEGHIDKALDLCDFVKRRGIIFGIITYNSVINGLCRQGCLTQAFRLFDSLERINLAPSEITYSTLIDALCKEGFLVDASHLYEKMLFRGLKPNTQIYNSLIFGYCKFGQLEMALKLLPQLENRGLDPDAFTVSSLLDGCCRKGNVEGALSFYYEFKNKGVTPDFLGFVYLMRGLCNTGRMEEARSILKEMLQTRSVSELINRVDSGIERESVDNFLAFLCEQGNIKEALMVLNEVGAMLFPVRVPYRPYNGLNQLSELVVPYTPSNSISETNMDSKLCSMKEEGKGGEIVDKYGENFRLHDFHDYYSKLAILCSTKKLQQANELAKEMISNMQSG
ncbi:Pentatricopeptide repeat [Dillenia turbinata]|uniref:Pentatricopeptide repeat n=1 Tax=Dillenia turbinata TaxID=194707 RepID=A0AAN8VXC1_9MAGN